jgi:hypothetical protein
MKMKDLLYSHGPLLKNDRTWLQLLAIQLQVAVMSLKNFFYSHPYRYETFQAGRYVERTEYEYYWLLQNQKFSFYIIIAHNNHGFFAPVGLLTLEMHAHPPGKMLEGDRCADFARLSGRRRRKPVRIRVVG